jgi:hypothetical protein
MTHLEPSAPVLFTVGDLTVVTGAITLATLRTLARTLIVAVRRRRVSNPEPAAVTLVVKGPSIDLEMRLPTDVESSEILQCLMPLLARIPMSTPALERHPVGEGGFEGEVSVAEP